ncbi:MAG TPA: MFS transporter [Egibacteraceae bacterium]|nr:MFS transporter [Egibacteraceae bacterium]
MTRPPGRPRGAQRLLPVEERPRARLIFAITATGITGNAVITPSLPEILAGVGAAPGQAGLVIGATTLPGIFLAPVIGLLADRYGRREVVVPCLVLFAVAGGMAATSPSLAWLLGWRLLQGAGAAGLVNLAVVLVGDLWEGPRRAAMIGRNSAVLTTCLALGPLLGGGLTDLAGWRAPFLVYPVGLVTAALVARHLPRSQPRDVDVGQQLRDLPPALREPGVARALAAGAVTFAVIFGLMLTVLPLHLERVFGLGPTARGLLLGAPAIANTAVALATGRLQRFAKRALLAAAAVVMAAGLALIGAAPTLPVLVAAVLCFGAGEGLMVPNLQDIAASSRQRSRGAIVALFVSASRVGQTAGPLAAGAGMAVVGTAATFGAAAVACLALLLPLALVGRRGGTPLPPAGVAR